MQRILIIIITISTCLSSQAQTGSSPINREALVARHNVNNTEFDTLASVSVGNGNFAFTVDGTGLQTFPEYYKNGVPLGTQSQWGWHSFPNANNYKLAETFQEYDYHGRNITYSIDKGKNERQSAAISYLRGNAHRLHLGTIGFELTKDNGTKAQTSDITDINQTLDVWKGEIVTHFKFEGIPVEVITLCHQNNDMIAVKINSALLSNGKLKIKLRFPYPTGEHTDWACDWDKMQKHVSKIELIKGRSAVIKHILDSTIYYASLNWSATSKLDSPEPHCFVLKPGKTNHLEFSCLFTSKNNNSPLPSFTETQQNSRTNWKNYWMNGGVVDFTGSTDPRANELERRIVLSQYLTKIQCAGNFPPQETGLTYNSWFGKYHLEMHWWHAAHFAQWNHPELLEKSLGWYKTIVPKAKQTAIRQGFEGVRWPKMQDTTGNETPSKVGQMLIWQQPHIIYFAEQCYRFYKNKETLEKYKDLVFATADFMASFAYYEKDKDRYVLGPPVIAAQETVNKPGAFNPPYELAYWYWALNIAQQWRTRLGLPNNPKWADIVKKLPKLPEDKGLYLVAENAYDSYTNPVYTSDHPAVFGAYGVMPASPLVDPKIMSATYDQIIKTWHWDTTWGWDFPMMAMTATRLGEPEKAIDALLMKVQKNTYLKNGHNFQNGRLRIYLPGNGGLLAAMAMMCAGYDGCTIANPGIPKNGKWVVKWEGLQTMP
jgi:protein-glucosylgalactosylhydroxylysine glucosidase